MVVTHSVRIPLWASFVVAGLSALGWALLASPISAETVGSGSVRFEIVDAETGERLAGSIAEGNTVLLNSTGDPLFLTGVSPGEHTYKAVSGRYGSTLVRPDIPGELLTVTVTNGVETIARFEMTPPGKVRFQAVTEVTGDPLIEITAWTHVRVHGQFGDRIAATDVWFEVDVFPSPIENIVLVFDQSTMAVYDVPLVASGETVTMADALLVPDIPSVRGTVVDPDGDPIEGALVIAPSSAGGGDVNIDAWTTTGTDGTFYLAGTNMRTAVLAYPPADRPNLPWPGLDRPHTGRCS